MKFQLFAEPSAHVFGFDGPFVLCDRSDVGRLTSVMRSASVTYRLHPPPESTREWKWVIEFSTTELTRVKELVAGLEKTVAELPNRGDARASGELIGYRILAADDESDTRNLLKLQLQSVGASIELCCNGLEVLQTVRVQQEQSQPFSAIILDLRMPVMDGVQSASVLRLMGYEGLIIGLTADVFRAQELFRKGGPINRWILKPYAKQELIGAIRPAGRGCEI